MASVVSFVILLARSEVRVAEIKYVAYNGALNVRYRDTDLLLLTAYV